MEIDDDSFFSDKSFTTSFLDSKDHLSLSIVIESLKAAEDRREFSRLRCELVRLFCAELDRVFEFLELAAEATSVVLPPTPRSPEKLRTVLAELLADCARAIFAKDQSSKCAARLQLLLLASGRSRLPQLSWLPLHDALLQGLLTAPGDGCVVTAVASQTAWRKEDGPDSWRGVFLELLRPAGLETPQVVAVLSRLVFAADGALNLRLLLSLVASLTFSRQGAASALRALVRERIPAALDSGQLEAAGRALLVVRELGLEAASRQPHFAALSYADWWQCGPATGQCAPSLKAFRALLKLLWEWLPYEGEVVLLRPQIQHPAQPAKDLRSAATAADVRAFQDAARARLAEIRENAS